MGNCCESSSKYTAQHIEAKEKIVKAYNIYIARKLLKEARETKIKGLFVKHLFNEVSHELIT